MNREAYDEDRITKKDINSFLFDLNIKNVDKTFKDLKVKKSSEQQNNDYCLCILLIDNKNTALFIEDEENIKDRKEHLNQFNELFDSIVNYYYCGLNKDNEEFIKVHNKFIKNISGIFLLYNGILARQSTFSH